MNKVSIGNVIYEEGQLPLIGGPCVIESRDHSLKIPASIISITDSLKINFIFKS